MRAVKHKLVFSIFLILFSSSSLSAAVFDFDGDGKTDFIVTRPRGSGENRVWFLNQSRDGFTASVWGLSSNDATNALGDYDGDGRWDLVIARRNPAQHPYIDWYILNSRDNTMIAARFGLNTDQVMPQDYDGDGKTDLAVYRGGGQWYILNSRDGSLRAEKFGQSADTPYPGDYDGDGKTDYAFWRGQCDFGQGGVWTIIRSSDNQFERRAFGLTCTDFPVQGDYDGDGKTDIAVWRPGNEVLNRPAYFYILQSRDGFRAVQWGSWTDDAKGIYRQQAE